MKSLGLMAIILIMFSALWLIVWGWFFRISKKTVIRFRDIGKKAFEKGNYKKAKELLIRATEKENNPDLKYKLAVSHLNLKEYASAQVIFEELLKATPGNIDIMLKLALCLEKQKKYAEAIDVYIQILNKQPKDINCLLKLAANYFELEDYNKSAETLSKINELDPENKTAKILSLKCQGELCDPDNEEECQNIVNQYLAFSNNNEITPDFNIGLAKIYAKNGDLTNALTTCKKALENNAEDVKAYQLLGLIQLIKQDFEGAKGTLNLALGFEPKNEETHNLFSYVLCQQVDGCPLTKCREKYYKLIEKYLK